MQLLRNHHLGVAAGRSSPMLACVHLASTIARWTLRHYPHPPSPTLAVPTRANSSSWWLRGATTLQTAGTRVPLTGPLPVVSEGAAVAISEHGAQSNGAINPNGPSTTWYCEFGLTTDYGLQTASQTMSGLGARPINVRLSGLQAGSTYHFHLVADRANGLYVGHDHTFSTKALVRERARTLIVSAVAQRGPRNLLSIAISGHLYLPTNVSTSVDATVPWRLSSAVAARQLDCDTHTFTPTAATG